MLNQQPSIDTAPLCEFGRRRVRPSVVIADDKPHIRGFVREALEDMGFVVTESDRDWLINLAAGRKFDLVMLGLSAGGIAGSEVLQSLAANGFDGHVMIFAPPEMPMVGALLDLGAQLELSMLPLLPTPFSDGTLRQAVSRLLPRGRRWHCRRSTRRWLCARAGSNSGISRRSMRARSLSKAPKP